MTLNELAKRVAELERQLEDVKNQVKKQPEGLPWWMTGTGRHANDPVFDEIIRLGKQYRDSLHPNAKKAKPKKPKS